MGIPLNIPAPLPDRPSDVGLRLREMGKVLGQPSLKVVLSVVGSDVRIQVVNASPLGQPCAGVFAVRVVVGDAPTGSPTTATVSVTKGTLIATPAAGSVLDVWTADDGEAVLNVSASGASKAIRVVGPLVVESTDATVFA